MRKIPIGQASAFPCGDRCVKDIELLQNLNVHRRCPYPPFLESPLFFIKAHLYFRQSDDLIFFLSPESPRNLYWCSFWFCSRQRACAWHFQQRTCSWCASGLIWSCFPHVPGNRFKTSVGIEGCQYIIRLKAMWKAVLSRQETNPKYCSDFYRWISQ